MVDLEELLARIVGDVTGTAARPAVTFGWEAKLVNDILTRRHPHGVHSYAFTTRPANQPGVALVADIVTEFFYTATTDKTPVVVSVRCQGNWLLSVPLSAPLGQQVDRLTWYRKQVECRALNVFVLNVTTHAKGCIVLWPVDKRTQAYQPDDIRGQFTGKRLVDALGQADFAAIPPLVEQSLEAQLALLFLCTAEAGLAVSEDGIYLQATEPFLLRTQRFSVEIHGFIIRALLDQKHPPVDPVKLVYARECGDVPHASTPSHTDAVPPEHHPDPGPYRAVAAKFYARFGKRLGATQTPSGVLMNGHVGRNTTTALHAISCPTPTEAVLLFLARNPANSQTHWASI